jgi:hypothetical protein
LRTQGLALRGDKLKFGFIARGQHQGRGGLASARLLARYLSAYAVRGTGNHYHIHSCSRNIL